jgi:hypothetical protein
MTRPLLADRRKLAAAELHRIDSWNACIAHVRALADRLGVDARHGERFWIRIYGRESRSDKSADAAFAGWAFAVMREFPQARAA